MTINKDFLLTNKNIHYSILYIISPAHILSAICAIKSLHELVNREVIVIVHWPGVNEQINTEITKIVEEMANGFFFIKKILSIPWKKKEELLANPDIYEGIEQFKGIIGITEVDEIYYAHDIDGGMFQLLCTAYPNAKRICFGDTLGNVYEKEVHLGYINRQKQDISLNQLVESLFKILKDRIKRVIFTNQEKVLWQLQKEYKPHQAVLILPVDQSGNFLKRIPLVISKKETLLETLNYCINRTKELQQNITCQLQNFQMREKLVLLTDNIAEGSFIEFENEVEMYCSMIKENLASNGVVFLKSHPGETLPRNERIKEKLGNSYEVIELDKKFKRYPIELWRQLVIECKIVCISYPVLSLKYIYNKDVVFSMTDNFIEKWFPEWIWASYKNSASLYMEPLKNLAGWDGKSVLWSGKLT